MQKEITRKNFKPYRQSYLVEKCVGKKVLHIGPCDAPYTKIQLQRGRLLYKKISEVCEEQLGIDVDQESIDLLNGMSFKNSSILHHDMNKIGELPFKPDVIIFGEALEHLMNLEVALTNIKKSMTSSTELLITIPNALWYMNIIYAFFGKEHQHPDHSVAWTYKTIKQLLEKNSLTLKEVFYAMPISVTELGIKGKIAYQFVKLFPMFAGSLMVSATKDIE